MATALLDLLPQPAAGLLDAAPDRLRSLRGASRPTRWAGSITAITAAVDPADGHARTTCRSASLFAHIADQLPEQDYASPPQLALSDLGRQPAPRRSRPMGERPVTDLDL